MAKAKKAASASKKEASPTKKAEARARKQDSLKGVSTKAKASDAPVERLVMPIGTMPADRIR